MAEKKFRVVCYCRVATKNQNDYSPLEAKVSICVAMLKITV